jgi:hypothetical protein
MRRAVLLLVPGHAKALRTGGGQFPFALYRGGKALKLSTHHSPSKRVSLAGLSGCRSDVNDLITWCELVWKLKVAMHIILQNKDKYINMIRLSGISLQLSVQPTIWEKQSVCAQGRNKNAVACSIRL